MTEPKMFRAKFAGVQAMQFVDLDSYLEIVAWWSESNTSTLSAEEMFGYRTPIMLMNSRSGATFALNPGDWVIRDETGEFEMCERGVFEASYVEVGAA